MDAAPSSKGNLQFWNVLEAGHFYAQFLRAMGYEALLRTT